MDFPGPVPASFLQQDASYHIYVTGGDGSNRIRALEDNGIAFNPNSCGSGDLVIVSRVLENNAPNLWRLNMATGETKQLTFGKD